MSSNAGTTRRDVRYEPDERPPKLLSLGLGMQHAMIVAPSIVLSPTILIQSAGGERCVPDVGSVHGAGDLRRHHSAAGRARRASRRRVRDADGQPATPFSPSASRRLELGGPGLLATLIIVSSLFPVRDGGQTVGAAAGSSRPRWPAPS